MSEISNISVIVFNNCNNQQIYEKFNVHQVVHDYPSHVLLISFNLYWAISILEIES